MIALAYAAILLLVGLALIAALDRLSHMKAVERFADVDRLARQRTPGRVNAAPFDEPPVSELGV